MASIYLLLIFLPMIAAFFILLINNSSFRKAIVFLMSAILIGVALYSISQGDKVIVLSHSLNSALEYLITFADYFLLAIIFLIGTKLKNKLISLLAILQFVLMFVFEFKVGKLDVENVFFVDHLSFIMLLLINIIGPLIAIFALSYMEEHEKHLHLEKSRQNIFFAVIMLFLGAMNGLVISNNILWVYFFWEITTLCSFLLISHDQNEESIKNATRALLLNSIGGLSFVIGIIFMYYKSGTVALNEIISSQDSSILMIPIAFLTLAAFTKSAQMPFQSWLLGAMVAPTPVSALLHSSTMVKAGVYLVLRLSPVFIDTWLGRIVAVAGAFTFVSAALLAIFQSNAKRVLAYSTISNLGLIIALSSIAHRYAIYAAALLIVLHGVSKALLFLCVGSIEQGIGSRNIEDMDGIKYKMPIVAFLTLLGSVSMLLPPFGVLITKWIAIEVSTQNIAAMLEIILGSAFTVVFWTKFIGKILSDGKDRNKIEKFEFIKHIPLMAISILVVLVSIFLIQFTNMFVVPFFKSSFARYSGVSSTNIKELYVKDFFGFNPVVFFGVLVTAVVLGVLIYRWFKPKRYVPVYMSCENSDNFGFRGEKDKIVPFEFKNYYFETLTNEKTVTLVVNVLSIALIAIMFGVILK
ncbi:ech hydrogenase subunit A [Caldicellulosiruptor bescii]|nr:proton-conducting transporter membrane subunit [Caldicellulosiruptor bescii]PBC87598.1 ech hydrogenase subunit A [Caldicellulosiruptor bescii]PBC90531.1 ech hydrogenase subunit A [Caldicellulosiruptor bescii]PBD04037.1 ech hydrogenase subunit A [Caldicellulosiruptor bescii]PBD06328.1 ech hydrogenase subunit A [Caldicellulosiruptor bescii]PBD08666.1 ech hydrogenase subunit A [Caldicellulosiruptor bescii]